MNFAQNILKALGGRGIAFLALGTLAGLLLSSVDLGFTLLLHSLFSALGIQNPETTVSGTFANLSPLLLAAALIGVGIARSAGLYFVNFSGASANKIALTRLRLIRFHVSLEKNVQEPVDATEIQHAIHEIFPKTALFFRQLALCLGNSLYALGLIGVMVYHKPWLSLAALTGLALCAPIVLRKRKSIEKSARLIPDAHKDLMRGIDRVAQNWLFLKVMRLMDTERARLIKNTVQFNRESLSVIRMSLLSQAAVSTLGLSVLIAILFAALYLEPDAGIETLAFVYIFLRLIQTLAGLSSILASLGSVIPQYQSCSDFLGKTAMKDIRKAVSPMIEISELSEPARSLPSPSSFPAPSLSISNLAFQYGSTAPFLFKSLSKEIKAGEICAVVGPSGSGKTTLLSIIAGMLSPTEGEISLAGLSPQEFFRKDRGRVGFVGSMPYLIKGTLRENLCLGIPWEPSREEIQKALQEAQFNEKVESLEQGLEHALFAGGEGLSSGEKQRLCLARALLGRPSILILDEMSANLDLTTEQSIAHSLSALKGSCTIILTTHRTTFLALADQTITLPQKQPLQIEAQRDA